MSLESVKTSLKELKEVIDSSMPPEAKFYLVFGPLGLTNSNIPPIAFTPANSDYETDINAYWDIMYSLYRDLIDE